MALTSDRQPSTVSVMQAAIRLRLSYDVVRRLVVLGRLDGGQDSRGRWFVLAEAVERALHEGNGVLLTH
jgi:hypothetical protein